MIWFRAGLLAIIVGVAVVALSQTTKAPADEVAPPTETAAPTPRPTRVPLPAAPPELIISRVSRQTPTPIAAPTLSTAPWVEVVDYGYSPAQMQIHVGTYVTWSNVGNEGHDVSGTGPGGEWHSGPLAPGERYSRPFGLPGIYDYTCDFHPEMRGRIVVQP